jgi:hypothetical protein
MRPWPGLLLGDEALPELGPLLFVRLARSDGHSLQTRTSGLAAHPGDNSPQNDDADRDGHFHRRPRF